MDKREQTLDKLLKDISNYDLAMVGLPDSVGSFLITKVEEKLGLVWDDIKTQLTLGEIIDQIK